jgi:hypothetical protein
MTEKQPLPDFIKESNIFPIPDKPEFSVGKVWQENAGRKRVATINEIHLIGFSEGPPVILEVKKVPDGKPFRQWVRICGWERFLNRWSPCSAL